MATRRPAPAPLAGGPDGASGIRLSYDFTARPQRGADVANAVFELLAAVRDAGSIAQAARALGCSYRFLWGAVREWESAFGQPLVDRTQGHAARLTELGERLLWAELRVRSRMRPHIEALRSDLACVVAEARDTRQQLLTIHASHDMALPRLREHAAHAALHLDIRFVGSIDSIRSLNAGRCVVAGFHVPALRGAAPVFARALKPLLQPGVHKLIGCTRRTQGLMLRREHAGKVLGVADLARSPLRFVNRQLGSGTRLLMDHLMHESGLAPGQVAGYESSCEDTHVAVAACVASGVADVGPGVEAAAIEFGLHFVPLIEEDYFLVSLKQNLEHPAVLRLRQLVAGDAWSALLKTMPGYAAASTPGEVLSMTAALPWWRYAGRRKTDRAPRARVERRKVAAEP